MKYSGTSRNEYRYNNAMPGQEFEQPDATSGRQNGRYSRERFTRRNFLRSALLSAAGLVGFTTLGYAMEIEPAQTEITDIRLPLKRLAPAFSGLRMAQISDMHLGGWMDIERLDRVVKTILDLRPDVVLLTGDYLLGHHWEPRHAALLDQMAESFAPLSRAAPVYTILGNHDHWTSASAVRQMLAKAGAIELSNRVHTLQRGADRLHIAGVDDVYLGHARLSLVLRQLPADGAAILLAHEPDFADTSAQYGRFDLQISGHTHGGQVVLPLIGAPLLPHLGKKYYSGLYRVGEMYQYTNRGVGMSIPSVRLNCRPEITVFTLLSA